ncbi:MAG: hypothetical protein JRG85_07295 [Deltaproteobacteria bacterium]|nr:hypothetical protein [Deltaproteobacteria bacterium]
MRTDGLRLQDAPPLAIPLSFFLTAPLAAMIAGAVLVASGAAAVTTTWAPVTLGLTHLGTLGFLSMVMMGALYQMLAVVAGSPVPWQRLAHAVHALFVTGAAALTWGISQGVTQAVFVAIAALGLAFLLFVLPVATALLRAPTRDDTVIGIGAALLCLLLTAAAGTWMAHGHGGMRFPGPRDLWIRVHLCVALLGWVGGLIIAVSWQVLPMFYLAREVPRPAKRIVQLLTTGGALLPVVVLGVDAFGLVDDARRPLVGAAAVAAVPAVLSVWFLHPAASAWSLRGRRRKRSDASLWFWRTGLLMAPLTGVAAVAAYLLPGERWGLLFGWLAIWGWAGTIVHGMLTRIVPFLVWLHRFAPVVGEVPVPSVRALLPDDRARVGLVLHAGSVLLGAGGILSGSDLLVRAAGLALLATAGWLLGSLLGVARRRP